MLKRNKIISLSIFLMTSALLLSWCPWGKSPSISLAIQEELTQHPLPIQGKFPSWLQGVLVRNSSVPVMRDGEQISHPFDGIAMLHGFEFREGQVNYTNRYLLSESYTLVKRGNPHYGGFATIQNKTVLDQIEAFFLPEREKVRNASVNVFKYGESYVALTEIPLPACFDLKTLETLGSFQFQDKLNQSRCLESAHPHLDADTGEIFNFTTEFGRQSHYVLYRLPLNSHTRQMIARIPVDLPSYMHSFAMTENYLILTEFPLIMNPLKLMQGKTLLQSMSWIPEKKSRFIVVDKHTGQLITQIEAEPFFSFHHANAYEKDNEIILDLISYPNVSMMGEVFSEAHVPSETQISSWNGRVVRYHLSLTDNQLTAEYLLDKSVEFPRLNDRLDGNNYSYLYMAMYDDHAGGLVKINLNSGEVKTWQEEGFEAVEPIFIPAPEAKEEDEGIILTLIFNKATHESFLLALDGQTFQEMGRASLLFRIPDSFHGQFFSEIAFIPNP